MRALLLPVKDLNNAKKRLMGVLTPEERFALAEAMLADTIRAVRGVELAEKIFVVTNYEPAMRVAQESGWEILREEQQFSESDSVDAASRICEDRGVTALLRLPLDVPLVQASDIDELLAVQCEAPALVIVPSRDGLGTMRCCACRRPCFRRILAREVTSSMLAKRNALARASSCEGTPDWRWMWMMRRICVCC